MVTRFRPGYLCYKHSICILRTLNKKQNYLYTWRQQCWSPREIVETLKREYPVDMTMRISREAIYRYIYVPPSRHIETDPLERTPTGTRLSQEEEDKRPKGNTWQNRRYALHLGTADRSWGSKRAQSLGGRPYYRQVQP